MIVPVFLLIFNLTFLGYMRSIQMRNHACLMMTRLYSDHEEANKLLNRRNLKVTLFMGVSLFAGIIVAYFLALASQAQPVNTDTTYFLMALMVAVCLIFSGLIARQISLQSKETAAVLEANFLSDRVTIEQLGMIEDRMAEMDDAVQRLLVEERARLREEAMRQIG